MFSIFFLEQLVGCMGKNFQKEPLGDPNPCGPPKSPALNSPSKLEQQSINYLSSSPLRFQFVSLQVSQCSCLMSPGKLWFPFRLLAICLPCSLNSAVISRRVMDLQFSQLLFLSLQGSEQCSCQLSVSLSKSLKCYNLLHFHSLVLLIKFLFLFTIFSTQNISPPPSSSSSSILFSNFPDPSKVN